MRAAIASLPPRERKVIAIYYYAEATMKQIGAEIGVNESRVSQLHARAVQRLRKALGADCSAAEAAAVLRPASCRSSRRCAGCGWRRPRCRATPGGGAAVRAAGAKPRRRVPAMPQPRVAAREMTLTRRLD